MSPSDDVYIDRELCVRGSLHDAVRVLWPQVEPVPFIDNWHIGAVCEHLEAVSRCEIMRLVINIPPGCSKSRLTGCFWPLVHWLKQPTDRFMFASFDGSNTIKQARDSLDVSSSPWWKSRFGDIYVTSSNSGTGEYENDKGGYRIATSVGGKGLGKHCHIQCGDDLVKPLDMSKDSLSKAWDWWSSTMASRRADPKTFRRVLIMQRLHELDPAALAEKDGYEVLRLPMRFEPKACSYTSIGGDPRTEDGELLWPNRIDEATVKNMEKELGVHAPAQLQQRPVAEGGSIFQRDWLLKTWKVLPPTNQLWIQSWDCTFKDASTSDFVCGTVWCRVGGQIFLVDRFKERCSFTATCSAIEAMTKKYPRAISKLIEDKANGAAVIDTLQKKIPGLIAVNPEGGKDTRANAVSGLFQSGSVLLPEDAEWLEDYRSEMTAFPRGAHDDQVDSSTQALLYFQLQIRANLAAAVQAMTRMQQGLRPSS